MALRQKESRNGLRTGKNFGIRKCLAFTGILLLTLSCAFFSIPAVSYAAVCPISGNTVASVAQNAPLSMPFSSSVAYSGNYDYTWSITWGAGAPAGVGFNACSGSTAKVSCVQSLISGTPTVPGVYPFTLSISDGAKCTPNTAAGSITVNAPTQVTLTTLTLPGGAEGLPYSKQIMAECKDGLGVVQPCAAICAPLVYSKAGTWPNGVTIDAASGLISGTPVIGSAGNYGNVTVNLNTSCGATSQTYSVVISPQALPLAILTSALPDATQGVPYVYTLSAGGGHPPYSWGWDFVPDGLTIDWNTGTISGTPTTPGVYNINFSLWVWVYQLVPLT